MFSRTILDWPLVVNLIISLISTILSIDPRTSVFGYYSRFNGGLLSTISYTLLYWAFVSNLNLEKRQRAINYSLFGTTVAGILGVGEHFGINTTCYLMGFGFDQCWIQDVKTRVFSTFGQPNWLAAALVVFIPITWQQAIKNFKENKKTISYLYILNFIILLLSLSFTKSRSALLAFAVEVIVYWSIYYLNNQKIKNIKNIFSNWQNIFKNQFIKESLAIILISASTIYFSFFPLKGSVTSEAKVSNQNLPSLETGGTESGVIRKYVWQGAINVFKAFPVFGSGPETFAFSYPMFKPLGHNLTSEWDFIYNKAHNEYLNQLANQGLFGFISIILITLISIKLIISSKRIDLLVAYISILITNFFGFSTVYISLLTFLIPGIALADAKESDNLKNNKQNTSLSTRQKMLIGLVSLTLVYLLVKIINYWLADLNYNKARIYNQSNKNDLALTEISKAIKLNPNEPIYVAEMALSDETEETAQKALSIAPLNINIRRILINNLNKNILKDTNAYVKAEKVIKDGITYSPNDPKLYYQLGIVQLKLGKDSEAITSLNKAVELKPNYKDGHFALGMSYLSLKKFNEAKNEFEIILKNIDSKDELTKKYLEEANKKI